MKNKSLLIFVFTCVILAALIPLLLCGCTPAQRVNHNMNMQAEEFGVERRITVYNARTDNIVLDIEGYMNLSNNSTNELVVTVKTGPNTYKKNYVYLNAYTLYVVEDITGTHTDDYHYEIHFYRTPYEFVIND